MRGARAVPTWNPMPSVPTLTPTASRGWESDTGRGRNCATPSSPSSANAVPEDSTIIADAHRIVVNRRMSRPSKRHVSAVRQLICNARVRKLLSNHVRRRTLVLGADELDQLSVRDDLLIEAHGERRRVGL